LPPFIQQASQTGLLEPYKSVNYKNVPAIAKAADGWWATFVNNYFSFAINPEITKTAPKTFADLLSPDYTGKVAYSNPATAGDGMAVIILTTSLMGEDKAFNYLKKLEQSAKLHTKRPGLPAGPVSAKKNRGPHRRPADGSGRRSQWRPVAQADFPGRSA